MRIAVTGSNGFTGRHFAMAALKAGHEIIPVTSNIRDKSSLSQEISRLLPDAVVHLAAISFVGHQDEESFYHVNVIGTTHLLESLCALKNIPKKVLIASSANIYGNNENSPLKETEVPCPINHYATSKLAMELMAKTYSDRLPLIITRPFNYVGPGQGIHFLIPKLVDHFYRRAATIELGNIHVEREFNDVRMVCAMYLALLSHGPDHETFNICSGQAYALTHIIKILSDLTGHDPDIKINPSFIRANEIHRLCGDPAKINTFLASSQQNLLMPTLHETLQWMLDEASH